MTGLKSEVNLRRRRVSILALMFCFGIIFASWATRTPAIREGLEISLSQMGVMLLGKSVGSMTGVLSSARLVSRFGTKAVILAGSFMSPCALMFVGSFTHLGSVAAVALSLAIMGCGSGLADIALNLEGAHLEQVTHRSVLPALHGFISVGGVSGALLGLVLSAIHFPASLHLSLVGAVCIPIVIWALAGIPAGSGVVSRKSFVRRRGQPHLRSVWLDPRVLLIGVIVLAMAFAEGSANDWLPILIVDDQGGAQASGSLVYAGFSATMAIGRFSGGPLVRLFGHARTLAVGAACGALGVLGVIHAPSIGFAIAAVALWGAGSSLGFPVAISAAGDTDDRPVQRVSAVTTWGYLAFLVGPPTLGLMGDRAGLGNSLLVVVAMLVLAVAAAFAFSRYPKRRVIPRG